MDVKWAHSPRLVTPSQQFFSTLVPTTNTQFSASQHLIQTRYEMVSVFFSPNRMALIYVSGRNDLSSSVSMDKFVGRSDAPVLAQFFPHADYSQNVRTTELIGCFSTTTAFSSSHVCVLHAD